MTVEQAEQELAALAVRQRLLQSFIDLAKRLDGTVPASESDSADANPPTKRTLGTADRAYEVLERRGNLHINDLVKGMRAAGWSCSGDDVKDRNAAYAAMHRMPEHFVCLGNSVWTIRKRQD